MPAPRPLPDAAHARRRPAPVQAAPWLARAVRRGLHWLLALAAMVLLIDALFGEKGLLESLKARRESADLALHLRRLKGDNARLREEARRLREDPGAIEELARRDLGLLRPGEVVFIIKDTMPRANLESPADADRR